ncbi:MAG: UvrD-helicase domain-containing protein, partial [Candidatus Methanomethylophilaceae archaeon]|nr:UvrD-helicase domain-containing protein [Candidatus Methanomethylophilaceae archaeon]
MKNIQYINAGAGSGKTWTLTDKLAQLIQDGKTTPSRVILTTFTDPAAEEFRQKARVKLVEKGLHDRAAELDSAMIGTVHSVALRYIRKYWYL